MKEGCRAGWSAREVRVEEAIDFVGEIQMKRGRSLTFYYALLHLTYPR